MSSRLKNNYVSSSLIIPLSKGKIRLLCFSVSKISKIVVPESDLSHVIAQDHNIFKCLTFGMKGSKQNVFCSRIICLLNIIILAILAEHFTRRLGR